jgi:tetratricopeptide (TPR) repeat protein
MEKALHLIQKGEVFEPLHKLEIYAQLSSVYLPLGAYAEMAKLQQDCQELLQKLSDPYQHNVLFEQASELYEQAGNYEKAREILYHNLGFQQERELAGSIRKLYYNFGVTAQNEKKPLEAIENFQKALNTVATSTPEPLINRTYNNLAQLYLEQGKLPEARETALKVLAQLTEGSAPLELGRTNVTLGRISGKLGEPEKVDSYFQAAFQQFARVDYSQELADAYYIYAQLLSERGADQVSIEYLQKAYNALSSTDKIIRPYLR